MDRAFSCSYGLQFDLRSYPAIENVFHCWSGTIDRVGEEA